MGERQWLPAIWTTIFLLGRRQKEAETEEKRDPWMPFPEKREKGTKGKEEAQERKEMKKDAALSEFLQHHQQSLRGLGKSSF